MQNRLDSQKKIAYLDKSEGTFELGWGWGLL